MDGWTDLARRIREQDHGAAARGAARPRSMMAAFEDSDFEKMERDPGAGRLDRRGPDDRRRRSRRGTASCASGRASTTSTCRRSTSPARTSSTPTARASSGSPRPASWSAGGEYEVDCIIYASGFEVGTEYTRRAGYDLTGRDGVKLSEYWADGMRTQARHPRARLPERVHRAADAGREPDLQRAAQPHRVGQDDRDDRQARARQRRRRGRGDEGGRGRVDRAAAVRRRACMLGSPDCTPGYYNNEGQDPGRRRSSIVGYPHGAIGVLQLHRRVAHVRGRSTASSSAETHAHGQEEPWTSKRRCARLGRSASSGPIRYLVRCSGGCSTLPGSRRAAATCRAGGWSSWRTRRSDGACAICTCRAGTSIWRCPPPGSDRGRRSLIATPKRRPDRTPKQVRQAAASGPAGFAEHLDTAPVLLALFVDLGALAAVDRDLDRYSFAGGASVYPFAWSVLLAAHAEGLGGVITTMCIHEEAEVKELLDAPDEMALAAVIVLGYPVHRPRSLRRGRRRVLRAHRLDGRRTTRAMNGAAVADRLLAAGCVAAAEEASELLAAAPDETTLEAWLRRREQGEPLAWITGTVVFCGQTLHLAPGVYVPRVQTEELARRAGPCWRATAGRSTSAPAPGAVAAHLIARVPTAAVIGIDIDQRAAVCARRNGVPTAVADLDGPLRHQQSLDLVTAVAPYVPTSAIGLLPADVQRFEPRLAIDGGADGLRFVRRIIDAAGRLLRPGGWLLLEVGGDQDEALAPALATAFDHLTPWWDDDGDLRGIGAQATGSAT